MGIMFVARKLMNAGFKERPAVKDGIFIDVSSRSKDGWNVLSPFYDHGGIPVPGMDGKTSRTVEGIWQGLKVFEKQDSDYGMLDTGKPKKRRMVLDPDKAGYTGKIRGHLFEGEIAHGAAEARKLIYIPAYTWMIRNCPKAKAKFEELVELAKTKMVYVYDFENNGDKNDPRPYAHAALLAELVQAELAR